MRFDKQIPNLFSEIYMDEICSHSNGGKILKKVYFFIRKSRCAPAFSRKNVEKNKDIFAYYYFFFLTICFFCAIDAEELKAIAGGAPIVDDLWNLSAVTVDVMAPVSKAVINAKDVVNHDAVKFLLLGQKET
jgi:hypothetical protein